LKTYDILLQYYISDIDTFYKHLFLKNVYLFNGNNEIKFEIY